MWQEISFLTAVVVVSAYFLGESDQGGNNQVSQTTINHGGPVRSVVFRPDGMMLVSVGVDGLTVLWNLEGSRQILFPVSTLDRVRCAVISPNSKILATLDLTGTVTIHDLIRQSSRVLYQPRSAIENSALWPLHP